MVKLGDDRPNRAAKKKKKERISIRRQLNRRAGWASKAAPLFSSLAGLAGPGGDDVMSINQSSVRCN